MGDIHPVLWPRGVMLLALIHSPLVGSLTWTRLAAALGERGVPVVLPDLRDNPASQRPFWRQHAESAAQELSRLAAGQSLVLEYSIQC